MVTLHFWLGRQQPRLWRFIVVCTDVLGSVPAGTILLELSWVLIFHLEREDMFGRKTATRESRSDNGAHPFFACLNVKVYAQQGISTRPPSSILDSATPIEYLSPTQNPNNYSG